MLHTILCARSWCCTLFCMQDHDVAHQFMCKIIIKTYLIRLPLSFYCKLDFWICHWRPFFAQSMQFLVYFLKSLLIFSCILIWCQVLLCVNKLIFKKLIFKSKHLNYLNIVKNSIFHLWLYFLWHQWPGNTFLEVLEMFFQHFVEGT